MFLLLGFYLFNSRFLLKIDKYLVKNKKKEKIRNIGNIKQFMRNCLCYILFFSCYF